MPRASNSEVPEAFEETTRRSNEPHTGALGTGGHGYNEDETFRSRQEAERARAHSSERQSPVQPSEEEPRRTGFGPGFWIGLLVAGLVLAGIVIYGIHSRSAADKTLVVETKATSVPEVKVVFPAGGSSSGELTLPGNTQPFVDTPIYSRTNGYLTRWFFDIGAHVRKGQLLATIETPELDQQLKVAEAELKSSQANLNLANITSTRYQNLLKSNSVSKQETDQAMGDAASKEAAMEASMAGVRRLQQLQSFERVYAPFDGVITARNTDIGDLITGGSGAGSAAKQLFHLAAIGQLRVYVAVPENYVSIVRNGGSAYLTADAFPGETFPAVIARNASSIDPASRTLNVELDVPNASGKLLPGAYVMAHFKVPAGSSNLSLPSNTLLFRAQGMQVGVVRNNRVQLVPVKIAQDHGATVEIASGLTATDQVILDPSDSLASGQQVKVVGGGSAR